MRDFKYRELILGRSEWEAVLTKLNSVKSSCLRECAAAFAINLKRIASFGAMPSQIAFMVRRDQIFYDNAIFKIAGQSEIKLSDFLKPPPAGVREDATKQMSEFALMPDDEMRRLVASLGINYIETLIAVHPTMQDSIDATFASTVLGSWTAFECLVSDLWVAAVDCGPKEVALRMATSNQLQKLDENITAKTLHGLEFDPRTHYGSSLRETGRVSFQKLEHIKLYFAIAFGEEYKKLFTDTAGGYICALSAVRNSLIHKSGIADKKFVELAQRFGELKSIANGSPILLDGEIVRKLWMSAGEVGSALIEELDKLVSPTTPTS